MSIIDNLEFHKKGHEYYSNGAMYVWAVETSGCKDDPSTCTWEEKWDYFNRETSGCYYCALPCGNHTITGNRVRWWSSAQSLYIAWWAQGNCNQGNTVNNIGFEWANGGIHGDPTIDASILPDDLFANLGIQYYSGSSSSTNLTLTVNSENGSVTKSPDKAEYGIDEIVTIIATPDKGYKFDSWSGDTASTSTTIDITMNSHKTIIANFSEQPTSTDFVQQSESGSVLLFPNPCSGLLNIILTSEYKGEVIIKIYNLDGRTIEKVKSLKQDILYQCEFNIEDKSSGLYLVQIIAGDHLLQKQIIKK